MLEASMDGGERGEFSLPDQERFLATHPWVHHYEPGVPAFLTIPDYPLSWLLDETSRHYPERVAFIYYGQKLTYAQFARGANRFVGHLEDLKSAKYCISGAAPLSAKVQADFEAITHGKLVEGYGLSEAGPVTHCNPLTESCRSGSIGLPLPGVEAAIVDQTTGEPVPVGEVGELVVKGPNVMQGYWGA